MVYISTMLQIKNCTITICFPLPLAFEAKTTQKLPYKEEEINTDTVDLKYCQARVNHRQVDNHRDHKQRLTAPVNAPKVTVTSR